MPDQGISHQKHSTQLTLPLSHMRMRMHHMLATSTHIVIPTCTHTTAQIHVYTLTPSPTCTHTGSKHTTHAGTHTLSQ